MQGRVSKDGLFLYSCILSNLSAGSLPLQRPRTLLDWENSRSTAVEDEVTPYISLAANPGIQSSTQDLSADCLVPALSAVQDFNRPCLLGSGLDAITGPSNGSRYAYSLRGNAVTWSILLPVCQILCTISTTKMSLPPEQVCSTVFDYGESGIGGLRNDVLHYPWA